MKQKILKPFLFLAVLLTGLVSFTACDPDDPYIDEPITGFNWELTYVNGYPCAEIDVCEFVFYTDGTGTYGRYDAYGNWNTVFIQWSTDYAPGGAQYLFVYPPGGEEWQYLMRFYGGPNPTLELNDLATGDLLTFNAY